MILHYSSIKHATIFDNNGFLKEHTILLNIINKSSISKFFEIVKILKQRLFRILRFMMCLEKVQKDQTFFQELKDKLQKNFFSNNNDNNNKKIIFILLLLLLLGLIFNLSFTLFVKCIVFLFFSSNAYNFFIAKQANIEFFLITLFLLITFFFFVLIFNYFLKDYYLIKGVPELKSTDLKDELSRLRDIRLNLLKIWNDLNKKIKLLNKK